MNVSRRGFLSLLASASVPIMLDVERLLWVPGAKTIFLPTAQRAVTASEINGALKYTYNAALMEHIASHEMIIWNILSKHQASELYPR